MLDSTKWPTHIFHVDLSNAHPGETYYVHANGTSHPLAEHTPATRAALKDENPGFANVPDSQLTHYTQAAIPLPDHQIIRVHVKHTLKTFGIDDGAKPKGSSLTKLVQPPAGANPAQPIHGHINWFSTAVAFAFHHFDLMTHDPNVGGIILAYMTDQQNSQAIYQKTNALAEKMRDLGPPTPQGAPNPGWATLTPVQVEKPSSGSGTPPPPQTYYRQDPNDGIQAEGGALMTAMMVATKNDARLKNKKWQQSIGTSHISVPSTAPSAPPAPTPPLSSGTLTEVAAVTAGTGDNWNATLTIPNEQYGLSATLSVTDASTQTVNLILQNYRVRWLGVYVAFYNNQGQIIDVNAHFPGWSNGVDGTLNSIIFGLGMQNGEYNFLGYMEPIQTLFAIPMDGEPGLIINGQSGQDENSGITFSFPSKPNMTPDIEPTSAKIFACGMGTGDRIWGPATVFGGIATGVLNMAVPAVMMGFAVAAQTYKPLYKLLQNTDVLKPLVMAGATYFAGEFSSSGSQGRVNWRAVTQLSSILFSAALFRIYAWVTAEAAAGEAEDEIPFIGWVAALVNIATSLAQLIETIVAVAESPWFIQNTLALTITSTISVNPDPRHGTWPQAIAGQSQTCTLKIFTKGTQQPTTISTQTLPTDATNAPIVFNLTGYPLGGSVKVEVDFYCGSTLTGKASSGWVANDETTMAQLSLWLIQIPIAITPASVYQHSAILAYESGAYAWNTTATGPSATLSNLSNDTGGNQISICSGLALSQRHGIVAATFKAAGTGLAPIGGSGTDTQLFAFQSIDIPGMPMNHVNFPDAGFAHPTILLSDPFAPRFEMQNGQWVIQNGEPVPDPTDTDLGAYYIDPAKAGQPIEQGGGYHLRKIDLKTSGGYTVDPATTPNSHGRFEFFPDRFAFHPNGAIIGVNQMGAKVMTLTIDETGTDDAHATVARMGAGQALQVDREGLLFCPIAVTCGGDGTILILDQLYSSAIQEARIQAFDLRNDPVQVFIDGTGAATALLPLPTTVTVNNVAKNVTYLDIAATGTSDSTYIFVLYYVGDGTQVADYALAIYQYTKGQKTSDFAPLVTNTGISAASINVDMWHTLYTQNYQMVQDASGNPAGPAGTGTGPAGRTVTSVSEWIINNPSSGGG